MMSMTVIDDSIHPDIGDTSTGLPVLIFRPEITLFPDVQAEDEIIQCRHVRIQTFQGTIQALSTCWSAFTVFYRDETGEWVARPSREVTDEERHILDRISARTGHTAAITRISPKKPSASRPTLSIDLIQPNTYFDLVAEVLRILPGSRPDQITILLTDYSANLQITANPDHFELSPDLEHRLLLTTFWDNYAVVATQLQEGQILRILNLRSKVINGISSEGELSSDGSSSGLIAVLHGDRFNSQKVFLLDATSNEARIIEERKQALFGTRSSLTSNTPTKQPPSPSRSPLRTQRSRQFESQLFTPSSPSKLPHSLTTIIHTEIPITAIRTVLSAPEDEAKFVIKGRVVQHRPGRIADFVRKYCPNCQHSMHAGLEHACRVCGGAFNSFTFMFALDITDGVDKISAIVAYDDASRFLNGLQPCDLNQNPAVLSYLERCMQELLSSPLPTCFCIASYRGSDERRHRIFDTLLAIQ